MNIDIKKLFSEYYKSNEVNGLIISLLIITFVFSYPKFELFPMFILIAGFSFGLYEFAQRFFGKKFGYNVSYKIWPLGLLLAVVFTVTTNGMIRFVAVGAAAITPYAFGRWKYKQRITVDEIGYIATSGPLVNLLLAIIFKIFPGEIFGYISLANACLAFYNLLPIPPLDGSKTFMWKTWFWLMLFIISFILAFSII